MILNFIVTGANSQMACRQCVQAGPGAKLDRILDTYRNEAAVQAHFSSRHNSQPSVHQVSTDSNSPKEGGAAII